MIFRGTEPFSNQAPFVAKREEEIAAIQAAITAAQEVPALRKRYTGTSERAGSIQEMVVSYAVDTSPRFRYLHPVPCLLVRSFEPRLEVFRPIQSCGFSPETQTS